MASPETQDEHEGSLSPKLNDESSAQNPTNPQQLSSPEDLSCKESEREGSEPVVNNGESSKPTAESEASSMENARKKVEAIVVVDDDEDVPANCDLVEENLYLGNLAAACDTNLLKKYRISYILTIDSCPLPSKIQDLPHITTKFLKVSDIPKEDILQFFDETNEFIDSALRGNKRVLVHCYYGVSRSATLVLAYQMKKYGLSLEEAQNRLKQRRTTVGPNYGFLSQLKLYELMGYKVEKTNLLYKRFRLHIASDKLKSVKVLSTPYRDVIKADPARHSVHPEPVAYRCRKCRRILACASNVMYHTEAKSPSWHDFPKGGSSQNGDGESSASSSDGGGDSKPRWPNTTMLPPPPLCTQMLFIEPLAWMADVHQTLQGKLHCPNPNCKSKLGSFSWVMGCLCPCGAKVQPAFYLVPSKVDRSTSVLNVQITI